MDIYQCMTCGERWPHEGLERNMDTAIVHASRGHEVRVGDIDNLAREYKRYKKSKILTQPNDSYEIGPPAPTEIEEVPQGWIGHGLPPQVG